MIPAPAFTPIYIVVTRLSAEFWIPSRKFQPLSKLGWDPVFCGANAEHANGGVVAIESLEPRTIHLNQWKEASINIRHKIRGDHRGRHRICEKCIHRLFFAVRLAQRLVSEILELEKGAPPSPPTTIRLIRKSKRHVIQMFTCINIFTGYRFLLPGRCPSPHARKDSLTYAHQLALFLSFLEKLEVTFIPWKFLCGNSLLMFSRYCLKHAMEEWKCTLSKQ